MVPVTLDQSIEGILKGTDKISFVPDELAHWTTAVEATAKQMCQNKKCKIEFVYGPEKKSMRFFLENDECRDCLVESIEIHLPSMPTSLQGLFSVQIQSETGKFRFVICFIVVIFHFDLFHMMTDWQK